MQDITSCSDELLTVLEYISPVFPDAVLAAIEEASTDPAFCSKGNKQSSVFARLLRKFAYDDQNFDRAAELILRFAETEEADENVDSITDQLAGLFSLYLSGTQATPERRQVFLNRILDSGMPRRLEIAQVMFRSALKTSHWSSIVAFDFGARCRDYGWEPKTNEERLDWYEGFIDLLRSILDSENEPLRNWAKDILANHFGGLWNFTGGMDILEKIIYEHAASGKWPEMWVSIKKTIAYGGKKYSPEQYARLETLERSAAPSDTYSEIEAYALTNIRDHIEAKDWGCTNAFVEVQQRIVKLGELAASEPEFLERLSSRLWIKNTDALWEFGKGLAKGSADQCSTFKTLVRLMQKQELEVVQPLLFHGFIAGVHVEDPIAARQLQESVLEIPELKEHFICLLLATPIVSWGVKKLIELAKAGELDPNLFQGIAYGGSHKTISDEDFCKLLLALNNLDGGESATIEMLHMRFHTEKGSDYTPSDALRSVGRLVVLKLLSTHKDETNWPSSYAIDKVVEKCLLEPAPESEIRKIVSLLCEGIESYRLRSYELENVIDHLVKNYPEYILDEVLKDNENSEQLICFISGDRMNSLSSPLNLVPIERVIKWCDGSQDRIQKVASAISAYTSPENGSQLTENPKKVILSDHITSLLEAAKDKAAMVETIYLKSFPRGWSESLAEILEVRAKAFAELLNHASPEVQEMAKTKLVLLNRSVKENREQEAKDHARREQRFE